MRIRHRQAGTVEGSEKVEVWRVRVSGTCRTACCARAASTTTPNRDEQVFGRAGGTRGVRAKISSHFGASAGRADARRRDAGDVVTSSRSGNAADAHAPPRPAGRRLPCPPALFCARTRLFGGTLDRSHGGRSRAWETTAKCEVIFARALR
jgi:hypothetical protein